MKTQHRFLTEPCSKPAAPPEHLLQPLPGPLNPVTSPRKATPPPWKGSCHPQTPQWMRMWSLTMIGSTLGLARSRRSPKVIQLNYQLLVHFYVLQFPNYVFYILTSHRDWPTFQSTIIDVIKVVTSQRTPYYVRSHNLTNAMLIVTIKCINDLYIWCL